MKLGKTLLYFLLFLFLLPTYQQVHAQTQLRDSADRLLQKIAAFDNDSLKVAYGEKVVQVIKTLDFGVYDVLSGIKYMGYKRAPNSDIELFSWSIPLEKGIAFYHIFKYKEKGKNIELKYIPGIFEQTPPYLFYDFILFKYERKEYFALLGWGQNSQTNHKIVQIARPEMTGQLSFNHPLMKRGKSKSASLFFEYNKDAGMTLKQDKNGKRIYFDHLSPADKKYADYPMLYGPDGRRDALVLKKGEWVYQEDIKQ